MLLRLINFHFIIYYYYYHYLMHKYRSLQHEHIRLTRHLLNDTRGVARSNNVGWTQQVGSMSLNWGVGWRSRARFKHFVASFSAFCKLASQTSNMNYPTSPQLQKKLTGFASISGTTMSTPWRRPYMTLSCC